MVGTTEINDIVNATIYNICMVSIGALIGSRPRPYGGSVTKYGSGCSTRTPQN